MLQWEENYFVGEEIQNPEEIRMKIEKGKPAAGVYLLTLAGNPENVMELLPAMNLLQRPARELCPRIIGMARGKTEAMELARRILMESYQKCGTFRVNEYLKNR